MVHSLGLQPVSPKPDHSGRRIQRHHPVDSSRPLVETRAQLTGNRALKGAANRHIGRQVKQNPATAKVDGHPIEQAQLAHAKDHCRSVGEAQRVKGR